MRYWIAPSRNFISGRSGFSVMTGDLSNHRSWRRLFTYPLLGQATFVLEHYMRFGEGKN